ncbi:MAG: alpha-ribazole phosphatase [Bacteroidales bacterium]|jgi:alpha-ribazole phosphatase|nr:alpha-ribazole phosphatase [Bacteroidales bacterium]
MIVYLVRHTSVNVPKGVCYGQTDVPLNDTFPIEAASVKENLSNIGDDWDGVYCSPLSRCVKLAHFCGYTNALPDNRVKEMNFGEWEMQPFNEIKDPRIEEWYNDYLRVRTTGGESFEDQFNRVKEFLMEKKLSGKKKILVFAHGGVLICAKILTGMIDPKEAFSHLDNYGSVIRVEI